MFELDGYRVLVDYAHNSHAMTALGSFIDAIATEGPNGHHPLVTGRRIGVIATAGDRRDRDIRELGRVAAGYFDRIVIREDRTRAGASGARRRIFCGRAWRRPSGTARGAGRSRSSSMSWTRRHALDQGRKGDLVVLCVDHANRPGRSSNTGSTGRSWTCRRPPWPPTAPARRPTSTPRTSSDRSARSFRRARRPGPGAARG